MSGAPVDAARTGGKEPEVRSVLPFWELMDMGGCGLSVAHVIGSRCGAAARALIRGARRMASTELIDRLCTRLQQADRLLGDALRYVRDDTVSVAIVAEREHIRRLLADVAAAS
jgi:hypothetical protein